jgi:pimeloyl-ACP methyl ester carboxylesterase
MADFNTNDGVRIHYETEGRENGPPLLFAHSLGTDLHLWDAQAGEATGLGFRVIRYDARGMANRKRRMAITRLIVSPWMPSPSSTS